MLYREAGEFKSTYRDDQAILTIRQDTLDRRAFMPGVLLGIRSIRDHTGLLDSLEHLL